MATKPNDLDQIPIINLRDLFNDRNYLDFPTFPKLLKNIKGLIEADAKRVSDNLGEYYFQDYFCDYVFYINIDRMAKIFVTKQIIKFLKSYVFRLENEILEEEKAKDKERRQTLNEP